MSRPHRLLWILTLHCAEASELMSQALDEPLGLAERIALRGHLLACRSCRRFRDQLNLLRDALREIASEPVLATETLSADARHRIALALADASAADPPETEPPSQT
jgi:hypothetical protein